MEYKEMENGKVTDRNVRGYRPLPTPSEVESLLPVSSEIARNVSVSRKVIRDVLDRKDSRKIIFAGPCSIHDTQAGLEYARKLKVVADEVADSVYVVMRTYLEKPRSTVGWKGLVYDPKMDNSCDISEGIIRGREFLMNVCSLGMPCANEFVNDSILPQYIADFISWGAIGARTSESSAHRELASGLSMPIGFKNNTEGNIKIAADACLASSCPGVFVGIDSSGRFSRVETGGNKYTHIVLRGGNGQPNYHPEKVDEAVGYLLKSGLIPNVVVDCSHANSNKQYERQEQVAYSVLEQIILGNKNIVGIMIESNLFEGKQDFPKTKEEIARLKYGVSVTDSCQSFEVTEKIIRKYAEELRK
jgi:3-deoxy-7-phosphoheptulonate synthase